MRIRTGACARQHSVTGQRTDIDDGAAARQIAADDAAFLVAKLGDKAEIARELCYRLYTLCERKKRAAEALLESDSIRDQELGAAMNAVTLGSSFAAVSAPFFNGVFAWAMVWFSSSKAEKKTTSSVTLPFFRVR